MGDDKKITGRGHNNRLEPTEEQLSWLTEAVAQGVKRKVMADYLGVCEDTARRILQRHGIMNFEGAKYIASEPPPTWTRPCMSCKSTTPRPKNQYICDDCKPTSTDDSLPDGWYI